MLERPALALVLLTLGAPIPAADWPQYRGPDRDGVLRGGVSTLDAPRVLWRVGLGEAFSGIVIQGERLFTTTSDGEHDLVVAFDPSSGRELWRTAIDRVFVEQFGKGPRATPLLHGDRVYAISGAGKLVALEQKNGRLVWQVDLQELGAPRPSFGFAASPLLWDEKLIVELGHNDRALAAFSLEGRKLWTTGRGESAYSSPIVADLLGRTVMLHLNRYGLQAFDASGRTLLDFEWRPEWAIKPSQPLVLGPDLVLLSASYQIGTLALRIRAVGDAFKAEALWSSQVLRNQFNPSIVHGNLVYGFDNATLKAIDPREGAEHWAERGELGKGTLIAVGDRILVLSEEGVLKVIKADAERYQELATLPILETPCWTAPSFAGGRLFARDKKSLVAVGFAPANVEALKRLP